MEFFQVLKIIEIIQDYGLSRIFEFDVYIKTLIFIGKIFKQFRETENCLENFMLVFFNL